MIALCRKAGAIALGMRVEMQMSMRTSATLLDSRMCEGKSGWQDSGQPNYSSDIKGELRKAN
jgi:hypothetical protein